MSTSTPQSEVFGHQFLLDLYDCKEGVCDDLDLCCDSHIIA